MDRLIFDTNVLIAIERGVIDLGTLAEPESDYALPAVVVAEYRVGVELADSECRRRRRQGFLDVLVDRSVSVLPFGEETARQYARLVAFSRRGGNPRGSLDLMIAAHGVETGREIVTNDFRARFDGLPGVTGRSFSSR